MEATQVSVRGQRPTGLPRAKRGSVQVKKRIAVLAVLASMFVGSTLAHANAKPPTNGGNGAGQSGQCTGNPSGRPAVCPAT